MQSDSFEEQAKAETAQKPSKENGNEPDNNLPTNNTNSVGKLLIVLFIKIVVLGGVATGCWLIGDHFKEYGYKNFGVTMRIVGALMFFATLPAGAVEIWPTKTAVIWKSFCAFSVVLAASMVAVAVEKPPEEFEAVCQIVLKYDIKHPALLFMAESDNRLFIIPSVMYIQLTNLKDTPTMIESFVIESDENSTKHWIPLPQIDLRLRNKQLFWVTHTLTTARHVRFEQNLRDELFGKNIGSHETVQGWICVNAQTPTIQHLRLRIQDTLGKIHTAKFIEPKSILGDSLQPTGFIFLETNNISAFPLVHWSPP
jgi:hypothetical protein